MTPKRSVVRLFSVAACPYLILDAGHYRKDGTCRCDDPTHPMNQWGYLWDGSRWQAPDPAPPQLDHATLQRLADTLVRYDALEPLRREISDLYERGDFHAADPMVTEVNDDLAPIADEFAAAVRAVLAAGAPELLPSSEAARYEAALTVAVEADSPEQAADAFAFHLAEHAHPMVTVTNLDTGETTDHEI
jgi:hypothetical protein